MKAKIRDIGFSPNTIVVGVDFYFAKKEAGYDDSWVDVPDYPATEEEPNPPTHKVFVPFRSVSLSFRIDVTKEDAMREIGKTLQAFKRAHAKVELAQQFVGYEMEE